MVSMARNLILVFCLVMVSGSLFAQGSGTTRNYPNRSDSYEVTRVFKGEIVQLDAEQRAMTVTDEKSGRLFLMKTSDRTRFRADKGLFESKKISWAQLQPGQRVRVVFKASSEFAQEVKVIKPKKRKKQSDT